MFGKLMPKEGKYFDHFNAHAALISKGGELLTQLIGALATNADHVVRLADEIDTVERQADKITHDTLAQSSLNRSALDQYLASAVGARAVRLDVRSGILASGEGLRAARRAMEAADPIPAIVEREFELLERAARAGTLDATGRALAVRRLEEALQTVDVAVRDARIARARWVRRTSGGGP